MNMLEITRLNRIVIVGPHYSGPIANISDGIRKLAPCTVVAPTDRIKRANVAKAAIPPDEYEKICSQLFFRSSQILLLRSDINRSTIEGLDVSPGTRRILLDALSIPLHDQGGYQTGQVGETDVLGLDCPPINGKPGDLTTIINFAGKFWDLYRQGVFWAAKRVDGHSDLGGFVLYLKPADIQARTAFFPNDPDITFPIISESEANAFGGHDPFTGCKHGDGMSGTKAGMLASNQTVFWSVRHFEGCSNLPHFAGFLNMVQRTGKTSILGEAIYKKELVLSENEPFAVTASKFDILLDKIWDPSAPFEMPEQTARNYVNL